MLESIPFSETYKKLSNQELLEILANPDDYFPKALDAAKKEINLRQISEKEIKEIEHYIELRKQKKIQSKEKITAIEKTIKSTGSEFLEAFNPIQRSTPGPLKTIRFIGYCFLVIIAIDIISNFREIHYYLTKEITFSPDTALLYLLPKVLLIIATVTFLRKKKIGWILLTIFLTFSQVLSVLNLWFVIQYQSTNSFFFQYSEFDIVKSIFSILLFAAFLYTVCRKSIKSIFNITDETLILVIGSSGIISFFLSLWI